jgi:hypothetical protein
MAGLIAFNQWAAGTATPVSGMVKRQIARQQEPHVNATVLAAAAGDVLRELATQAPAGLGLAWPRGLGSLVGVLLPVGLMITALRRGPGSADACIWAAALAAHAFALRLWLSEYFSGAPWYYGSLHVLACLSAAWALGKWTAGGRARGGAMLLAGLKLSAACVALGVVAEDRPVSANRLAAAAWMRAHVPADERVGAWNAGELAYFSGRTMINLDGLVNDHAYYERIRRGAPEAEYFEQERIEWLADYAGNVERLVGRGWREAARFGAGKSQQLIVSRKRG